MADFKISELHTIHVFHRLSQKLVIFSCGACLNIQEQ